MSDELIRQLRFEADANAAEVRRLTRERDEARRALDALIHLVSQHRCNCDGVMPVGECVDSGRCGCSAALLARAINETKG
jgi:hypothetical protein